MLYCLNVNFKIIIFVIHNVKLKTGPLASLAGLQVIIQIPLPSVRVPKSLPLTEGNGGTERRIYTLLTSAR